jgi:hypothetical protein
MPMFNVNGHSSVSGLTQFDMKIEIGVMHLNETMRIKELESDANLKLMPAKVTAFKFTVVVEPQAAIHAKVLTTFRTSSVFVIRHQSHGFETHHGFGGGV